MQSQSNKQRCMLLINLYSWRSQLKVFIFNIISPFVQVTTARKNTLQIPIRQIGSHLLKSSLSWTAFLLDCDISCQRALHAPPRATARWCHAQVITSLFKVTKNRALLARNKIPLTGPINSISLSNLPQMRRQHALRLSNAHVLFFYQRRICSQVSCLDAGFGCNGKLCGSG